MPTMNVYLSEEEHLQLVRAADLYTRDLTIDGEPLPGSEIAKRLIRWYLKRPDSSPRAAAIQP